MIIIDPKTERIIFQKLYELTYNLNPLKKHLINQKINQLTINDLMYYASKYNIDISVTQATKIYWILKTERFNITDHAQIMRLIRKLDKELSSDVRNKVIYLIEELL
ncbi:MAG: DUF2624 family protein [Vulcanibacillus sp.]